MRNSSRSISSLTNSRSAGENIKFKLSEQSRYKFIFRTVPCFVMPERNNNLQATLRGSAVGKSIGNTERPGSETFLPVDNYRCFGVSSRAKPDAESLIKPQKRQDDCKNLRRTIDGTPLSNKYVSKMIPKITMYTRPTLL